MLGKFYPEKLANDFWSWLDHEMQNYYDDVEYWDLLVSDTVGLDDLATKVSWEQISAAVNHGWAIIKTSELFFNGHDPTADHLEEQHKYCMDILRRAHENYRSLFEDQEEVRKRFVPTVAKGFTRMPLVRRLQLCRSSDNFQKDRRDFADHAKDTQMSVEYLVQPSDWEDAIENDLGPVPHELLTKLPICIHQGGIYLTSLEIDLPPPRDYTTLLSRATDRKDLRDALQGLRTLRYCPCLNNVKDENWSARDPAEMKAIFKFFAALVDTASLKTISLSAEFLSSSTEADQNIIDYSR